MFKVLGVAGLVTIAIISITLLIPHPVPIELNVRVNKVEFDALPPIGGQEPYQFFENVKVKFQKVTGADRLVSPLLNASPIEISVEDGKPISLKSAEGFLSSLKLRGQTRVSLQSGPKHSLTIVLRSKAQKLNGIINEWSIGMRDQATLKLEYWRPTPETQPFIGKDGNLLRHTPNSRIFAGSRTCTIGLRLDPARWNATTNMTIVDLRNGDTKLVTGLELDLKETKQLLAGHDSLVVLEPKEPMGKSILTQRLVANLNFEDSNIVSRTSFILGGEIRVRDQEKASISLNRGDFVQTSGETWNLKSIRSKDCLELVLWGEPRRLMTGPTDRLMTNAVPSWFVWLMKHKQLEMVFGILIWVIGISIGTLKVLGMVKTEE